MAKPSPLYVIGLTGNTGSGKTTVANYLKSLGAHIIDADVVAREVVQPGEDTLEKIIAHFGEQIVNQDGTLNRRILGTVVFRDKVALSCLNSIIHPAILDNILTKLDGIRSESCNGKAPRIAVIDAPLLIETNLHKITDQVWVVVADSDLRLKRVMERDNISKKQARDRMSSQLSQKDKVKMADRVIHNEGRLDDVYIQVKTYWQEILGFLSGDD